MIAAIYNISSGIVSHFIESNTFPAGFIEANTPPGYASLVGVEVSADERQLAWRVVSGELQPAALGIPPAPPPPWAQWAEWAKVHMDEYALTWNYENILTAVSFIGDPVSQYNADAVALRNWRSAVRAWLETASTQPVPSPRPTEAELRAMLPAPPTRPVV